MKLKEIFSTIESLQFAVPLNLASSLQSFITAVERDSTYQALRSKRSKQQRLQRTVLKRALALISNNAFDPRYERADDVAIATYLVFLMFTAPLFARNCATRVEGKTGFWWARKLAKRISAEDPLVIPEATLTRTSSFSLKTMQAVYDQEEHAPSTPSTIYYSDALTLPRQEGYVQFTSTSKVESESLRNHLGSIQFLMHTNAQTSRAELQR